MARRRRKRARRGPKVRVKGHSRGPRAPNKRIGRLKSKRKHGTSPVSVGSYSRRYPTRT